MLTVFLFILGYLALSAVVAVLVGHYFHYVERASDQKTRPDPDPATTSPQPPPVSGKPSVRSPRCNPRRT